MLSAIYEGEVRHVRTAPARHAFTRSFSWLAIDLDEWPTIFQGRWLWGRRGFWPYSVRRRDHLGDPGTSLKDSIHDWIESTGRPRPSGRVVMFTLPGFFGFAMNPVSMYFCFDPQERLQWVVAEVNNTPWGERQCYLLDPRQEAAGPSSIGKSMHVSPFLPMDLDYRWALNWTESRLGVSFHCRRSNDTLLSVSLDLTRHEWFAARLRRWVWRHPLGGLGVWLDIYWQAVRLKFKGVPIHSHPRKRELARVPDVKASR